MRLNGKTVLVTGAGRGIGAAIAILFATEGAKVVVNDIDVATGNQTADKITKNGGKAIFVKADVSKSKDVQAMVQETIRTFGRIDVLVNNAAVDSAGAVHETSEEDWDHVIAVNLTGQFLCAKYTICEMLKQGGGNIIFISSIDALQVPAKGAAYNAAKAALLGLTKSVAWDYGSYKIRANALCPGAVQGEMMMNVAAQFADPEKWIRTTKLKTPLHRWATPEEIAHAALFLASDECSYTDGATIVIDGGVTAGVIAFPPQYMEDEHSDKAV
jgi:NAD(P)-dependent dehydrogenase (short-subunit alcohol dehydrogenase family)